MIQATRKNGTMVIVPHSDDEVIMAAGIIKSRIEVLSPITIVIATNGDYLQQSQIMGKKRIRESINALGMLGVQEEDIIFMGYADTGFEEDISFLYQLYLESDPFIIHESTVSKYTYGDDTTTMDYHYNQYGSHGLYNRKTFEQDLMGIIDDVRPSEIFTTSIHDCHFDHVGLAYFVRDAIDRLRKLDCDWIPVLYEGIVHSMDGDDYWPSVDHLDKPMRHFDQPMKFHLSTELKWDERVSFPLPESLMSSCIKDSMKYKAMLCYKTQMKQNVMDYLLSFVKAEEIFWCINYQTSKSIV